MNLLYVGTLFPHPGGTGISGSLLLAGLVKLGHRVRAIAPITSAAWREDPMPAWCPEIAVSRYPIPFWENDAVVQPAGKRQREDERRCIRELLLRLLSLEIPDVILVGRETFVHEVPAVARRFGVPWILRLGGHLLMGMAEGSYTFDDSRELRDCFQSADLVLAEAEHIRPCAEAVGCRHVAVIPNLVDIHRFAPRSRPERLSRALGIHPQDVVVLHASNLKPVKRAGDIVDSALPALAKDSRLMYVMVGDGGCRPDLEAMVTARGLQDRFRFTGWVDYQEMPEYMALADMVVMPSEREQQARVYLETQSAGRTLIASDIPGSRAIVTHRRTGLLYPTGDVGALAEQVLTAAGAPSVRKSIGVQARSRVASQSVERISALVAATAENLVGKHVIS